MGEDHYSFGHNCECEIHRYKLYTVPPLQPLQPCGDQYLLLLEVTKIVTPVSRAHNLRTTIMVSN